MATIRIKRKKERFNRSSICYVLIDRIRRGELVNGGAIDVEVPEGQHLIQVEYSDGVFTSPILEFNVREGETKHFLTRNPKLLNPLVAAGVSLFLIHAILKFILRIEAFYLLILMALPLSVVLYYTTVGRFSALKLIPEEKGEEKATARPARLL